MLNNVIQLKQKSPQNISNKSAADINSISVQAENMRTETIRSVLANENDEFVSESLEKVIEEAKKTNPFAGVNIGAHQIVKMLTEKLNNERGLHVESLLAAIASMAGYACQASLRKVLIESGQLAESEAFSKIETDTGNYFVGALINEALFSAKYSIWSLAGGAVRALGYAKFPDVEEISRHSMISMGSDSFGLVRLPEGHILSETPLNYISSLWQETLPYLQRFCDSPLQWPVMLGIAAQEVISNGKDILSPELAFQIIMECAVPMSKIDPELIGIEASK